MFNDTKPYFQGSERDCWQFRSLADDDSLLLAVVLEQIDQLPEHKRTQLFTLLGEVKGHAWRGDDDYPLTEEGRLFIAWVAKNLSAQLAVSFKSAILANDPYWLRRTLRQKAGLTK
jgi:hypothetical protein